MTEYQETKGKQNNIPTEKQGRFEWIFTDSVQTQIYTPEIPDLLYAIPCNLRSQPWAEFVDLRVLPTTYVKKKKRKQMRSQSSRAVLRFALVCLHAQIALSAGNIRI